MDTSFDKFSIDKQVQFLNTELKKDDNSSITKLCKKFGLNKNTIVSRFGNKGYNYSFNDKQYVKEVIQKDTNSISEMLIINQEDTNNIEKQQELQKSLNEVRELIEMKEQLKEVIQEYNKSKNKINIPAELRIDKSKLNGEVKGRLIKVYSDFWIKFCKKNNEFKMQDLYSIALLEFIEKYNK